jgi:hypothetical protein
MDTIIISELNILVVILQMIILILLRQFQKDKYV